MKVSQPRLTSAIAASGFASAVNSVTSAPAMKPLALPDRIISAFGGSCSKMSSASFNSANACCESVFVVAPARSNVSVATPSSARVICQFCIAVSPAGPSQGTDPPPSGAAREASVGVASYVLDQHRAALPAADADRCDAAFAAGAFEHVQQMQHEARARCAHGMAHRDGAAVDVQLRFVEHTERARQPELASAELIARPCAQAGDHLRSERLVDFPGVEIVEC